MKIIRKKSFLSLLCLALLFALYSFGACALGGTSLKGLDVAGGRREYVAGDCFDPAGLSVNAVYSDGTKKELSSAEYAVYPEGGLSEEDEEVIIEYTEGGKTVRKAVEVTVTPASSTLYRMEAESAEIEGGGGETVDSRYGHAAAANLFFFDPAFSGNILAINTSGLKFTFCFTADRAANADVYLYIGVANYVGESPYGRKLSDYVSVRNNGVPAAEREPIPEADAAEGTIPPLDLSGSADKLPEFEADYYMVSACVSVDLVAGNNRVEVEILQNSINFDYLEIESTAALSGFVPASFADPETFVSFPVLPTQFKRGEIRFCDDATDGLNYREKSYEIPTLDLLERDADGDCVLTVCGRDFKVSEKTVERTLTIDGTDVSFADGGNRKSVRVNSVIPAVTVADGKILKGWTADGKFWHADSFIMPDKDVTLTPVFAKTYTLTLGGGLTVDGRNSISLVEGAPLPTFLSENFSGGEIITGWTLSSGRTYAADGNLLMPAANVTLTPTMSGTNVVVRAGSGLLKVGDLSDSKSKNFDKKGVNVTFGPADGSATAAAKDVETYETLNGVEALAFVVKGTSGGHARIKTTYAVRANVTYCVRYTLKNYGEEEIVLQLSQINTGTDLSEETAVTLRIGAGETKSADIVFSFDSSNANMLLYFGLLEDIPAETKLALSAAVCENYVAA